MNSSELTEQETGQPVPGSLEDRMDWGNEAGYSIGPVKDRITPPRSSRPDDEAGDREYAAAKDKP